MHDHLAAPEEVRTPEGDYYIPCGEVEILVKNPEAIQRTIEELNSTLVLARRTFEAEELYNILQSELLLVSANYNTSTNPHKKSIVGTITYTRVDEHMGVYDLEMIAEHIRPMSKEEDDVVLNKDDVEHPFITVRLDDENTLAQIDIVEREPEDSNQRVIVITIPVDDAFTPANQCDLVLDGLQFWGDVHDAIAHQSFDIEPLADRSVPQIIVESFEQSWEALRLMQQLAEYEPVTPGIDHSSIDIEVLVSLFGTIADDTLGQVIDRLTYEKRQLFVTTGISASITGDDIVRELAIFLSHDIAS